MPAVRVPDGERIRFQTDAFDHFTVAVRDLFGIGQIHRQLERPINPSWQVDEFEEFVVLTPVIGLTVEFEVETVLFPIADRCKFLSSRGPCLPEIEKTW